MIHFKIATPERVVYEAEVEKVSIPTELGQITILPGHIPLVANLAPGELQIYTAQEVHPYVVTGGFFEVRPGNQVVVLADAAEHVEEIDVARAEAAREAARKLMAGVRSDDVRFADATAALERSLARLRVATKKRYRRLPPVEPPSA